MSNFCPISLVLRDGQGSHSEWKGEIKPATGLAGDRQGAPGTGNTRLNAEALVFEKYFCLFRFWTVRITINVYNMNV